MPRNERRKSNSGIYHIILRGINRQEIFHEKEDFKRFLWTLYNYTKKNAYEIYAYCLMDNHVHILLKEGNEPLGIVFRKIGASFVYWYNTKYERTGHLFQDRFKSEPVEDDCYFLVALRYIHLNPVKAGLCLHPEDYPYSSYSGYERNPLIHPAVLKQLITHDEFIRFHYTPNNDSCMDIPDNITRKRMTDTALQTMLKNQFGLRSPADLLCVQKTKQENIIRQLHQSGATIRQLSRLTGFTQYRIYQTCHQNQTGDGSLFDPDLNSESNREPSPV